jgi:hypothetical protein
MAYGVQKIGTYDLRKQFGAPLQELTGSGKPQYFPANSLMAWWRLNTNVSSAGDVTDSSGNGRPGTFDGLANRPDYSSILYPSTRIQAASCEWDGTDTAVNIGTAATWDAIIGNDTSGGSTQQMSFSMWVYKTGDGDGGSNQRLIDFGGDVLILNSTGEAITFRTYWTPGYVDWYTPASSFSLNTWAHIVLTYDANSTSNVPVMYVDGAAVALTHSGNAPSGAWSGITLSDCKIGSFAGSDAYTFQGNMADVAVWNKILTADEVSALYNAASYGLFKVSRNFDLQGSTFTNTGSIEPFYQGINVRENKYFMMGLTPKIRPGAPDKIFVKGVDLSAKKYYDDTLVSANANVLLLSGARSMVPSFEMQQTTYGQAKLFNDDVPYTEMQKFNAKQYLEDDTGAMIYPYVGSNPAARDPYQNDGVIEPLYQIRQSLSLMTIEFPYLAQGVWGTLGGTYAIDSRRGSVLITQQINNVTSSLDPYEDSGTEYFGTSLTGSVALPGFLTEQQARIGPWTDDTAMSIHIKQLTTGSQAFAMALNAMSGTNTQRMLKNHHRSATAGFVYDNNSAIGTDSIAFGGWKK